MPASSGANSRIWIRARRSARRLSCRAKPASTQEWLRVSKSCFMSLSDTLRHKPMFVCGAPHTHQETPLEQRLLQGHLGQDAFLGGFDHAARAGRRERRIPRSPLITDQLADPVALGL